MPRPDRYRNDDGEGYGHGGPRPPTSPVLIIALVLGGVLVVGVVACGMIGVLAWKSAPQPGGGAPGAVQADAAKRVYTRQEFRDLVMGKTEEEVIAAVGNPDETTEAGNVTLWTYRDRINDPAIGKADPAVVVVFRDGRVAEVEYSLGPM